jgi:lysophospholipase
LRGVFTVSLPFGVSLILRAKDQTMRSDRSLPPSSDKYLKTSDGALLRYKVWKPTTPSDIKPRLLLLQGRATFIEKFTHFVNQLRAQGYEVWTFDWRGQGLSTRETGRAGYIDTYATYLKDLDFFIKTFLKNESLNRPLLALGQSMGAHILLRYMVERPNIVDGAVLAAPMFELNTGIYSKSLAKGMVWFFSRLGMGKHFVFGHEAYDPATEPFEGNLLTHNPDLFYYHRHIQMDRPELVLGGVTFGWVKATLDSMDVMLNPAYLGRISKPIHIYTADDEHVVDNSRIQEICSWMPNCRVETIPESRHQLLAESINVQSHIAQGIDDFVNSHFDLPILARATQNVIVSKRKPIATLRPIPVKELTK